MKALSHVLQQVFSGLLIGAMLPYWFSSMTMKSVGKAALAMVDEVRHQFNTIAGLMEGTARPDYKRCVEISTKVRMQFVVAAMYPCIDAPPVRSMRCHVHCPDCAHCVLCGSVAL